MKTIIGGIKPLDIVLTAVLAVLAVLIGLENMNAGADADVAHAVESHSWLMIPVFVLAVLPIAARRTRVLEALAVSTVIIAASLPMFGWVTRCGFALPLSIAFAYAIGRFAGSRARNVLGLVGVVLLQVLTLVQDSATGGLGALGLAIPSAAIFYGAGLVVENLAQKKTERDHDHAPAATVGS